MRRALQMSATAEVKAFCFFFSKKKAFLPFATSACNTQPDPIRLISFQGDGTVARAGRFPCPTCHVSAPHRQIPFDSGLAVGGSLREVRIASDAARILRKAVA